MGVVQGLVVLALLFASGAGAADGAKPQLSAAQGEIQDAVGDAQPYLPHTVSPDIRSASADLWRDTLLLRVRFSAGTFSSATTFVQFILQLQKEGVAPGSGHGCCSNYIVDFGGIGEQPGRAQLKQLGTDGKYEDLSTLASTTTGEGLEIEVPTSSLPNAISRIDYRVVTCVRLTGAVSTILDAVPDTGFAPATMRSLAAEQRDEADEARGG